MRKFTWIVAATLVGATTGCIDLGTGNSPFSGGSGYGYAPNYSSGYAPSLFGSGPAYSSGYAPNYYQPPPVNNYYVAPQQPPQFTQTPNASVRRWENRERWENHEHWQDQRRPEEHHWHHAGNPPVVTPPIVAQPAPIITPNGTPLQPRPLARPRWRRSAGSGDDARGTLSFWR